MQEETKNIENGKKCFIITPIGSSDSSIRRSADGLINTVLRPLLEEDFGFEDIVAAHEINASGSINNQIMKRVIYDDLVIANLTGVNPNVMYEIAVRHSSLKPIIHICEKGTKLPFDIVDQRTLFYENDMQGVVELRLALANMVRETLRDDNFFDNPVYNATQSKILIESVTGKPDKNLEKYLIEKFESLESKLVDNTKIFASNKGYKYSETFKILIQTRASVDLEIIGTSLKEVFLKREWYVDYLFIGESNKIDKFYETSIRVNLVSNRGIPFTTDVAKSILQIDKPIEKILRITGNELPF